MPVDLSSLTPEEIADLKAALDAPPPEDPVKTLASVVEMLISRMQPIEERLAKLESFIEKDLVGGIQELSEAQAAASRIAGIKGKYGDLFSPFGSYLSDRLGDPEKIYDLLDKHLAELKGADGYSDEMGESSIKSIAEEIGKRMAEITGKPVVVESASATQPAPEAAPVEAAPEASTAEEPDPLASIKDYVSKLRERNGRAA